MAINGDQSGRDKRTDAKGLAEKSEVNNSLYSEATSRQLEEHSEANRLSMASSS